MAYISEVSYYGSRSKDFVEVVLPEGTDPSSYSVTGYVDANNIRFEISLSDITPTTENGFDIYVIDSSNPDFGSIGRTNGVSLNEDTGSGPEAIQFVGFHDPANAFTPTVGPAAGQTSTYIGRVSERNLSLESTDGGQTYHVNDPDDPGSHICFCRGTRILTSRGEIPIEDLQAGDKAVTVDHGLQSIRWVGFSTVVAQGGDLAPILFEAGALGNTGPLRVSPQHRMIVSGPVSEMLFGESEVLVPAKSLINDRTIRRDPGDRVDYFHMLFDRHEIVWAEGARSESFFPGHVG